MHTLLYAGIPFAVRWVCRLRTAAPTNGRVGDDGGGLPFFLSLYLLRKIPLMAMVNQCVCVCLRTSSVCYVCVWRPHLCAANLLLPLHCLPKRSISLFWFSLPPCTHTHSPITWHKWQEQSGEELNRLGNSSAALLLLLLHCHQEKVAATATIIIIIAVRGAKERAI